MSFKKIDPKQTFPKMEEEVLKFWNENKIFEKSLEKRKDAQRYSFYDGPPFATGMPHYGHIVASTMKDVVPRYWTMRGFYVERKWGWDCHGLPIENIVEKELGSQAKKDIEAYGVAKFNELCRSKVLHYVEDWKAVINRMGRWADMENSYKTMDLEYMESVWWIFKELWDRGLIYEGYRAMHVCPRCETTLSQSEVTEGYKDIKDLSAIAKFELLDDPMANDQKSVSILAWTTTPWTLIGNVALAVNPDIDYVYVETVNLVQKGEFKDEIFVVAKARLEDVMKGKEYEIVQEVKGADLVGKAYRPLFDFYASNENLHNHANGWKVYGAEFVTTEDGTGVVHIAPAFGEDDMNLGKEKNLPFVQHVGMDGVIKQEAGEFAGLHVKPIEDVQSTDVAIIKYLAQNNLLFAKEKYEHSYPHCWRCDTPLINYATSSWFVNVTKIKPVALDLAKEIHWSPEHMKEGRFGNWLSGARDWSISRQRFWASVIPIWRCECGEMKVFGSAKELEQESGKTVTDLHKHIVDEITVPCSCGKEMHRVPDVLDTWFDSGSMPYAQLHYPFENGEKFDQGFPADFIAEGVDQTRAWFYYLHVIASAIKEKPAFKNVIVNGTVLAEDGKKMSKRLQNYPDPVLMFDKYGADAMRQYLMSSPVVAAQNLNFSERDMSEVVRGMLRMLWNSYSFFVLYANIDKWEPQGEYDDTKLAENFLDFWILSELNKLITDVNVAMEHYELHKAARLFPKFVDNLSNWYIRRSRKRFWKSENDTDKNNAYATLHHVLVTFSQVIAPFMPFIADEIYRNLTGKESVHLSDFPVANAQYINTSLNEQMATVREIISQGLQQRAQAKIKVRQPLASVEIKNQILSDEMMAIIREELNVKDVVINPDLEGEIQINTEITEELKQEGMAREIVRFIQEMRKTADYEVDNHIQVWYQGLDSVFAAFGEMIAKETLADFIDEGPTQECDLEKEFDVDGERVVIQIKR